MISGNDKKKQKQKVCANSISYPHSQAVKLIMGIRSKLSLFLQLNYAEIDKAIEKVEKRGKILLHLVIMT